MSAPAPKPMNNPYPQLIKPSQVENLPFLANDAVQKQKMHSAVSQYWAIINKQDMSKEDPLFKNALESLTKISNTIRTRLTAWKEQNAGASAAQRPQSQGQQQQQQQAHQVQGGAPVQPNQNTPARPQQPQAAIPPQIVKHLNEFNFINPPDKPRGTPAGDAWLKQTKENYAQLLLRMERFKTNITQLDNVTNQLKQQGKQIPAELTARRGQLQKEWEGANGQATRFREQQMAAREQQQQQQQQQMSQQQPPQIQNNASQQTIKSEAAPQMQQPSATAQNFNMQLSGQQNAQQQQQQRPPQPAPVNPAMANAQNQMRPGTSPAIPQSATSFAQPQVPNHTVQHSQQQSATGPTRPPLNTHLPPQQGAYPGQQSATDGPQNPQTLSQQEAIAQAQRSYSDRPTPQSAVTMGQAQYGGSQIGSREPPASGSKFPIPKTLPDRATALPTPVAMTAPRPTLSGPANGLGGILGQPPIEKQAGTVMLDSSSDGGIVSRKKLQELLREVGGPDEFMTPQVEDLLLGIADEFVDNLTVAGARIAKMRGGAQDLQIRDLQMVLERHYNIRIPGYASDETRVVRRFQPNQQWMAKLNAVQAAKVMGGKMDI